VSHLFNQIGGFGGEELLSPTDENGEKWPFYLF